MDSVYKRAVGGWGGFEGALKVYAGNLTVWDGLWYKKTEERINRRRYKK